MSNAQRIARINDVLYLIHRDLAANLSARRLSQVAAYSEQNFHRVFQKVVGETVLRYVRRVRLEQAANQLMFAPSCPIAEIAEACGYMSLSSFGKVFVAQFGMTPGQWRKVDRRAQSPAYLLDPEIAAGYSRIKALDLPQAKLLELAPREVAYVRHQGYGRSIRFAWQTLQVWASTESRPFSPQIGLHHSNPAWTPLPQCRYVACLGIDRPLERRGVVNSMSIPGGLHAVFYFSGRYGELLPWTSKVLEQWLPASGFKAKSTPAFVEYQKNHFLAEDEHFELRYYLPVSFF